MIRVCSDCSDTKPLSEYYRHPKGAGGYSSICKVCIKQKMKLRRAGPDGEKMRAYDRERAKTPERIEHVTKITRFFRAKHPERYKAHTALNNAIRDGKIVKKPCRVCGSNQVHAHHHDYSKPLDVDWLCALHHHRGHHQGFEP